MTQHNTVEQPERQGKVSQPTRERRIVKRGRA